MLQKMLLKDKGVAGEDIDEAANGHQALEKAKANDYRIIFLDWNMPEMNGLEFVKAARQAGIKTPIIMCTSEGEKSMIDAATAAGADAVITKPIDKEKFWETTQQYL